MCRHENVIVDSQLETLSKVQAWFDRLYCSLEPELGWVKSSCDRLNIAIAEGFTNAVRHAHSHLPAETPIEIEVDLEYGQISIRIWDQGPPFDPTQLKEPEPGSLLTDGGYGWFLLRRAVDHVKYQRLGSQNCLTITHYRHSQIA
ncbi:MAG: ATP-binding protein [Leptolyngbyaceae cyanobacterium]